MPDFQAHGVIEALTPYYGSRVQILSSGSTGTKPNEATVQRQRGVRPQCSSTGVFFLMVWDSRGRHPIRGELASGHAQDSRMAPISPENSQRNIWAAQGAVLTVCGQEKLELRSYKVTIYALSNSICTSQRQDILIMIPSAASDKLIATERVILRSQAEIPNPQAGCQRIYEVVCLPALDVGLRRGVLPGLEWEDVELMRRLLQVKPHSRRPPKAISWRADSNRVLLEGGLSRQY